MMLEKAGNQGQFTPPLVLPGCACVRGALAISG